jgi:hypothetical protein
MEAFFVSLGLPVRLSEINIDESHFDEISRKTLLGRGETVGNVFKLDKDDIKKVLKIALS